MEILTLFLAIFWFLVSLALFFWQFWRFRAISELLKDSSTVLSQVVQLPPLSLIVACRNESANLKRNLEHWLGQDYPNFELICVDDHSHDDTAEILENYAKENASLSLIRLSADATTGKKNALAAGIAAAHHEHLVFCDADCEPASKQWLKHIGIQFSAGKDLILGYGKLKGSSLFHGLVDFETVRTLASYWHYAYRGQAYGAVGRNLAYTKKLYDANQAHKKHFDLRSGDDDLFVNSIGQEVKIGFLVNPEAFTISSAPSSYGAWMRQKGRHYSTAWRYRLRDQFLLGLEGSLILLFWLLLPFGFILNPWSALSLFLARYVVNMQLGHHPKLFALPTLNLLWPMWELIWVLSTFVLHLRNLLWGASKEW